MDESREDASSSLKSFGEKLIEVANVSYLS